MEYRSGDLLYVCRKGSGKTSGLFVLYRDTYKGFEDLSYHGSPWYEKFIICEYLDSRDRVDFGNQQWEWYKASEYICELQKKLNKIKELAWV